MDMNRAQLQAMIGKYFSDLYSDGETPEQHLNVAEVCLLKDFAQFILGYEDDDMVLIDDRLHDLCFKFIDDIKKLKETK